MSVVVDSSAVLAALFDEPGGEAVSDRIGSVKISTVNLAEVATKLVDSGYSEAEMRTTLLALSQNSVAFDAAQAIETGALRTLTRRSGLSLGDRACLALAKQMDATVLTADRAWAGLDVGCDIELIR